MPDLGTISYGLAGVGFLLLTLLLAVGWEGRSAGIRLIVACGITALWGLFLSYTSSIGQLPPFPAVMAEALRYAAWIFLLTGMAAAIGVSRTFIHAINGLLVVVLIGSGLLPYVPSTLFGVATPLRALTVGGIGLSLLGLVLVEQVYRNARADLKYSLRYLMIALGVIFAYDLFVFAQAQLLHGIEEASWLGRGLVTAITIPLLAIAARRNPHWALNVFVSRQVVFYTATFMAVGLYLLVMALGGYLIAAYGGTWGRTVQLVFLAGAAVVLVTLVASADIRRRAKVFLAKHFYRNKYDYRVEWLRFIQTLSEGAEHATGDQESARPDPYSNAIRAIAQIISSPGGILFLRREDGRAFSPIAAWPQDRVNLRRVEPFAADDEMVAFLDRRQWVIDADEHRLAPDVYDNIALPALFDPPSPHRIVLPLLEGSSLLGVLVLDEPPGRFTPNYEDRDLLKTVGRHVATYIAQHEADRRLAENRQFEAYHRLTAFVMHDLKNLAAQLSLIVANAEKHKRNPEFVDDAISTVAHSTERMQRLIEQLQGREQRSHLRRVSVAEIVRRACERCAPRQPAPAVEVQPDLYVEADPERLTAAIEHLVRNAQDATPDDGSVSVRADGDGREVRLTITDTGSGMTPEFVGTRLFKPFDTTKGSKGMGIGAYQAREYVASLGGSLTVRTAVAQGTTFEVRLQSASL